MHKFKVGDKVRVIGRNGKLGNHKYNIGDIVTLKHRCEDFDNKYGVIAWNCGEWYIDESEVEPITPPRQIELGGTYTSKNGHKWKCIGVKGDVAWLAGDYSDGLGTAYRFNLDGTPICHKSHPEYQIIFPPVVEVKRESVTVAGETVTIRYEVIDGVADLSDATIEAF